ncbi:type 1 glutamine amidotransferase [Leucobacter sp. VD1]|uniref:type 1 glutamine amidotransferase n=1 Tax=Leucobacter sp. VD1 TaxID=3080381 RepID=UPI003FA52EF9
MFASAARSSSSAAKVLVVEHEHDAGAQRLGAVLIESGAELTVVGPDAGAAIPETLDDFDALVVLGGTPGPNDDAVAPWLPATRALVSEALRHEIPYLGVCLGAQILAVVAGGTVSTAAQPEVGLAAFALTDAAAGDPLLDGLDRLECANTASPLRALQWHFLEVTQLPTGSTALASNQACRNQAFRVGSCAWGVQFHLEANSETASAWATPARSRPELAAHGLTADGIISEMLAHESHLSRTWGTLTRRWLALVQK